MTSVLAVASEAYPLLKTGGLADVVGALPPALKAHGIDMSVMLPGYPAVMKALTGGKTVLSYPDLFGGPARVIHGPAQGFDLYAIDAPHLYDRPGNPYVAPGGSDWPDNWMRFAALGRVAADAGKGLISGYRVQVLHLHDWQAAMTAAYVSYDPDNSARTILTVHNLAFQGQFAASIFPELGLPQSAFALEGIEYYGDVGFLKAGLQCADWITTVSPTYAEEICTPGGGMGLDGLLRLRRGTLTGIVNGIDTEIWNPETDKNLAKTYGPGSLKGRAPNKVAIEKRFGLEAGNGPLFCVVSRLTWQKGMDILAASLDALVRAGGRLALLGSGDAAVEVLFTDAASRHTGRIGVVIGYDEALSHLLQGGSDAILIPSRFEPCGLTQLYGLRYGCVPVVSRVGGLADTIVDANDAALAAGVASGLQFATVDQDTLERTFARAASLYADPKAWQNMQLQGMKMDVSWGRSAGRYAALYRQVAAMKVG
ncbi:MAG: glycogen synthase GlgA [Parvibaculaceae bacterium]